MFNKLVDMIVDYNLIDKDVENIFIDKLVDPDYDKNLLYCLCAIKNNYVILKLLMKYGNNCNYNTNEALYFAYKNNSKECIELLYNNDVDINTVLNTERY